MKPTKSKIQNLKSTIGTLARFACRLRGRYLRPTFRWLSYAVRVPPSGGQASHSSNNPQIHSSAAQRSALRAPTSAMVPPEGPPKLRLRKRRLSVQSPKR